MRYCGYKHREKRRVALMASHLECGAQLATQAKLEVHVRAKAEKRKANKAKRALGQPEDDDVVDPYLEVLEDEVDDPSKPDMLSRPGRLRQCAAFAARLETTVAALVAPKPPKERLFGTVPHGFMRDFGFWEPGASPPDAL